MQSVKARVRRRLRHLLAEPRLNHHRLAILRRGGLALLEETPGFHPPLRPLVHLLRVRLENDPLARAPPAYVRVGVVALGDLPQEVVLVLFGLEVDILLRALERAEIALRAIAVGLIGNQKAFHERRVEDFAEAVLLDE